MENRFEFTVAIGKALEGVAQLGNAFKGMFSSVKKEAEKVDDAFAGMSVDDVKQKIAQLNTEIGKLSNRDDIKKKQAEIEALNGKLNELVGDAKQAAEGSGGGGGGIFGAVFGGSLAAGIASKGLGLAASALGSVKSAMIDGNAEMETYTTQFSTLLGSTEAAKERLAELARFGASTPFELPEVARAEKVLVGFGLTGKKALDLTGKSAEEFRTVVGDIAAGTGASFEEIALNMGKMSSGATGEAISRFQEMGIATKEQLAAMGVEFDKAGSLVSPLPVAMQAITKIAEEKFGGGMANLSSTFGGMVSTFQDTLAEMGRTIGGPIFAQLKTGLEGTLTMLGSPEVQGGIKAFAEAIGAVIGSIINNLGKIAVLGGIIGGIAIVMKGAAAATAAYNAVMMVKAALTGKMAAADIAAAAAATGQTAATTAATGALGLKAVAMGVARVATWAWNAALMANPIILIATAIIGLGALIYGLVSAMGADTEAALEEAKARREQIAAEQELNKELRASTEAERDALQSKIELTARFEQLGAMTTRTKEQEAEYQSVLARLAETYPEAVSQTSTFAENLSRLRERTAGSSEELAALNTKLDELQLKELRLPIDAAAADFNVAVQSMRNDIDELADTSDETDAFISSFQQQMAMATDASQIGEAKVKALSDAYSQFGSSNPELYKKLADSINGAAKAQQEWIDKSADMVYATSEIGKATAAFLKTEQDLVSKGEKTNKQFIASMKARVAEIKGSTAEEIRARKELTSAIQTATDAEIAAEKKAEEERKAAAEKRKKAADEAKKKHDEAYKEELADLKRKEQLDILNAKLEGAGGERIAEIQAGYLQKQLDAANKWKQDKETIANAEHAIATASLQGQIDLAKQSEALEGVASKSEAGDRTRQLKIQAEAAQASLETERQRVEMALALRQAIGDDDPITALQAEQEARAALSAIELAAIDAKIEAMKRETAETIRQLELEHDRTTDAVKRAELEAQIAKARADGQKGIADATRERASTEAKIEGDLAVEKVQLDKTVRDQKSAVLDQILGDFKTVAGEQSAVGKAIAVTQTIIQTVVAAQSAYASAAAIPVVGWILGPIAAAAAALAGAANVQKITSTPTALAEGGLLNKPTFVAGEAGAEVVAPLRALPGLMAASLREAFGEKAAPVNKRGQKTERIAADVHLSTSAVARQERRAQMTRSNRYS